MVCSGERCLAHAEMRKLLPYQKGFVLGAKVLDRGDADVRNQANLLLDPRWHAQSCVEESPLGFAVEARWGSCRPAGSKNWVKRTSTTTSST